MRKGQVSVEMLLAAGIAILIFLGCLTISHALKNQMLENKKTAESRKDCLLIANAVNSLDSNSEKAGINVRIMNNAAIEGPIKAIFFDKWSCRINTRKVSNGSSDVFNISKGIIRIEYSNKTIFIKNE